MNQEQFEKQKISKLKKLIFIAQLILLLIIVIGIPCYIWFFEKDFLLKFNSLREVTTYLNAHKSKSVFIYIGVQILQIIISVIPGQVFQFAAGYVFGIFQGIVYSIVGAAIGTSITYSLARFLGYNGVSAIIGEENSRKYVKQLNSKKAYNIVFILYLIPGIPKDMLGYAAGISKMKFKTFIIVSLLGRLPAMLGSILIGSLYYHGKLTAMFIILGISILLFLIGILFHKKVALLIDKFYDKVQ